jgi:hypothetical protein
VYGCLNLNSRNDQSLPQTTISPKCAGFSVDVSSTGCAKRLRLSCQTRQRRIGLFKFVPNVNGNPIDNNKDNFTDLTLLISGFLQNGVSTVGTTITLAGRYFMKTDGE